MIKSYSEFKENAVFEAIAEDIEFLIENDRDDEIDDYLLENWNIQLDITQFVNDINEWTNAEKVVKTGTSQPSIKQKIVGHFKRNKDRYAIGAQGALGLGIAAGGVYGLKHDKKTMFNKTLNVALIGSGGAHAALSGRQLYKTYKK